jgi:hypothetical protein
MFIGSMHIQGHLMKRAIRGRYKKDKPSFSNLLKSKVSLDLCKLRILFLFTFISLFQCK